MSAAALPAAFARSLASAGVARAGAVAVALSGGPDSLALAALTARWGAAQRQVRLAWQARRGDGAFSPAAAGAET